jgi:hypothetical protein
MVIMIVYKYSGIVGKPILSSEINSSLFINRKMVEKCTKLLYKSINKMAIII